MYNCQNKNKHIKRGNWIRLQGRHLTTTCYINYINRKTEMRNWSKEMLTSSILFFIIEEWGEHWRHTTIFVCRIWCIALPRHLSNIDHIKLGSNFRPNWELAEQRIFFIKVFPLDLSDSEKNINGYIYMGSVA